MTQETQIEPTFDNIGVARKLLTILHGNSFVKPTPVQHRCIPKALEGKDIVGIAQTGTGKTLAFAIPIIQKIINGNREDQSLVIVPTRELAIQADEMICKIGSPFGVRTTVIIGGAPIGKQIKEIRRRPHVVIATPGRLIDHLERKSFHLQNTKIIVLDEADRMFDIGFLPDIKRILSLSPSDRQTLLFSATMPSVIAQIASRFMKMPVNIEISPSGTAASGVRQQLFVLENKMKLPLLEKILADDRGTVLVFSRTRRGAGKIKRIICSMGHSAAEIHSDRSLSQRKEAMSGFKSGKYRILVATDIAARGIDVSDISLVVNYDLPQNAEDYVHRIGRTGRAGSFGRAVSFVTPDQRREVKQIERLLKKTISVLALPDLSHQKSATKYIKNTDSSKNKTPYKKRFNRRSTSFYGKKRRSN